MSSATDLVIVRYSESDIRCTPLYCSPCSLFNLDKKYELLVNGEATDIYWESHAKSGGLLVLSNSSSNSNKNNFECKCEYGVLRGNAFVMSCAQLHKIEMHLKSGMNCARLAQVGTQLAIEFCICFTRGEKMILSDIDGTISRSDVRGLVLNAVDIEWTHRGVCKLFCSLEKRGYQFVYVSARPFSQYAMTRAYIEGVDQTHQKLPRGPVVLAPHTSINALSNLALQQQYKCDLFEYWNELLMPGDTHASKLIFAVGFGNHHSDSNAYYEAARIPRHCIVLIDASEKVRIEFTGKEYDSYDQVNESHFFLFY